MARLTVRLLLSGLVPVVVLFVLIYAVIFIFSEADRIWNAYVFVPYLGFSISYIGVLLTIVCICTVGVIRQILQRMLIKQVMGDLSDGHERILTTRGAFVMLALYSPYEFRSARVLAVFHTRHYYKHFVCFLVLGFPPRLLLFEDTVPVYVHESRTNGVPTYDFFSWKEGMLLGLTAGFGLQKNILKDVTCIPLREILEYKNLL